MSENSPPKKGQVLGNPRIVREVPLGEANQTLSSEHIYMREGEIFTNLFHQDYPIFFEILQRSIFVHNKLTNAPISNPV